MRLGIDTGGTFTDFVVLQRDAAGAVVLRTHKVLSTPMAPERAILQGIFELGLADEVACGTVSIVHGSTVATNAALEGKGVRTAYISNRGFADVLSIGRQTRRHLYRLQQEPLAPPVPAELCLATGGRIAADGSLLEALTDADIAELVAALDQLRPRAVAINFLFSFLDDEAERRLAAALRSALPWLDCICHSSAVLPEYREYERGIATWLNASLGPHMARYLRELKQQTAPSPLAIMQSSGGTIAAEQAADNAVRLLLSGPAGGLAAVKWLAEVSAENRFMTFDMGGTSTDVALFDGKLNLTSEGQLGPWPVAVPMVDMHTIGAGGGSIAWLDAGGLLQVGPHSAGASPGPACYGAGGEEITVTDANLLLGTLLDATQLAGRLKLDKAATIAVFKALSEKSGLTDIALAEGVIRLANEHMAQALRMISLARGHDPRHFRLCCFGGAGGLHVCALAEELGMNLALIPAHAGVFSALGMLLAPVSRQLSHSIQCLLGELDIETLQKQLQALQDQALAQLQEEGHSAASIKFSPSADLRYRGQSASLNVPWHSVEQAADAFGLLHKERYRFCLAEPVELLNIRLTAEVSTPTPDLPKIKGGSWAQAVSTTSIHKLGSQVPVYNRDSLVSGQLLTGPALIIETSATTLLLDGWEARVDAFGSLWLQRILLSDVNP